MWICDCIFIFNVKICFDWEKILVFWGFDGFVFNEFNIVFMGELFVELEKVFNIIIFL